MECVPIVVPIKRVHQVPMLMKSQPAEPSAERSAIALYKRTNYLDRSHARLSTRLHSYPENIIHSLTGGMRKKGTARKMAVRSIGMALAVVLIMSTFSFTGISGRATAAAQNQAQYGWNKLEQAETALNEQQYQLAGQRFNEAERAFSHTESLFQQVGQSSLILPYLSGNDTYSTAQALLLVALDMARAGGQSASLMQNLKSSMNAQAGASLSADPFAEVSQIFATILLNNDQNQRYAVSIAKYTHDAQSLLTQYASRIVDNPELEKIRLQAWQKLPRLVNTADTTSSLLESLPSLLGSDRNRRYLILFQNNNELRPGGGFLGSFASTILKKGQVDGFAVETNIYKRDETFFKTARVASPYPLTKLSADWFMRDSNWDVDFSESARRTAWFYKQEGGVDVDGVLAIDSTLMVDLLKITGPIEIPSQHITMTADNFVQNAVYKSEREYLTNPAVNAANEPKAFIADMFPLLLKKISQNIRQDPAPLMHTLGDAIKQKHLLFAPFFDSGRNVASKTHLDNSLPQGDDFLLISNANLGGLKSSLQIQQNVDITIQPTNHNTLLHTVHITRTHHGTYDWPDGDNHNYIRLAIPKDARYVQSASSGAEPDILETDADIEVRDGYATLGRWLTTPVGSTRDATFTYETAIVSSPLSSKMYYFHYIKQPGWLSDNLKVAFRDSANWSFHTNQAQYVNSSQKTDATWVLPLAH